MNEDDQFLPETRFIEDIYKPSLSRCNIDSLREVLRKTDKGKAVLQDEESCDQYLAMYGGSHFYKLLAAFKATNFPAVEGKNIEIVDWGCGQALATSILLDYFTQQRIQPVISRITLVEPSFISVERGRRFVLHMLSPNAGNTTAVQVINKPLDDILSEDFNSNPSTIKVHLFSNILDVDAFNIENLYKLIVESFNGLNRFIGVSPKYSQSKRLDTFYNLFSDSFDLSRQIFREEDLMGEVFFFRTKRYERRTIKRYERQFTVTLAKF